MLKNLTRMFPLWALLFSGLAFLFPRSFARLRRSIVPLLGKDYFPALSMLPEAVFSIWHNLSGSLPAICWNRLSTKKKTRELPYA